MMLGAIAAKLGVRWAESIPVELNGLKLDAFTANGADGRPVLVEVFAHVGKRKAGQTRKIALDMTKLLLAEREMGTSCTKILVLARSSGEHYPLTGWQKRFADAFSIEAHFVDLDRDIAERIADAQLRQQR